MPPPRRRARLVNVVCAVLVLALAAAGVIILRPGPVAEWLGATAPSAVATSEPPEPAPSPVLADAGINAPAPAAAGVQAAIDKVLTDANLGSRVGISVVDVASGEGLYDRDSDAPITPASTTKLITAVTVLAARGPAYQIPTRVTAGANPGEVVLVGGGDPTLAVGATGSYPGAARLDRLADEVKRVLGGSTPTRVVVDSTLFSGPAYGPGWDDDIPTGGFAASITALMTDGGRINPKLSSGYAKRFASPDLAAGRAFAEALGLPADGVKAVARGTAPAAPVAAAATAGVTRAGASAVAPGMELGRVQSPPMVRLVELMLSESDNVLAESLARQVALARNQPASFAGAGAAMNAVLAELGLPATESALADGSGLSRSNRITPALLTSVLGLAASGGRAELAGVFAGLPVAGWSGTLSDRYHGQAGTGAGAGTVRAKTGTLTGINAISGVVTTAQGRLLAFAVLADRVPVGADEAQRALDRIAAALATCGCR